MSKSSRREEDDNKPRPGISSLGLLGVFAAHLTFFIALVILLALTYQNNGFVSSPTTKSTILEKVGMDWSVIWVSLPTLLLLLLALCRNWEVDKVVYHVSQTHIRRFGEPQKIPGTREERVSLLGKCATDANLADGRMFSETPPENTIDRANISAQDYLSRITITRSWSAYRNKDFNLMTALFLSSFMTIILQPLMGSLIKDQQSIFVKDVVTYLPLTFRGDEFYDLRPELWTMILGTATAETLYGGQVTPWTNQTHAFRPLDPQADFSDRGTLTATSKAYAAHLSCAKVTDIMVEFDTRGSINNNVTRVNITATDRGCDIFYIFDVNPSLRPFVLETFQQTACGLSNSISRVLMLATTATQNATVPLNDMILISCVVAYSATDGNLTVSWAAGTSPIQGATAGNSTKASPTFVSFYETEPVVPKKDFIEESFEGDLLSIFQLQYGANSAPAFNSQFGSFVADVATSMLSSNLGDNNTAIDTSKDSAREIIRSPDVLFKALPLAFVSVYRVAVARAGMIPVRAETAKDTAVIGRLETLENRLWVRYWVVGLLMGYLAVSAASCLWLTRWWGWTIHELERRQAVEPPVKPTERNGEGRKQLLRPGNTI
jgi:hypothetical protein